MSSVNRVIILGNLGADPELRYNANGVPNVRLSVATSHRWKDKAGELKEETTWHRVVVWSKSAEHCNTYLKKGRQVCVEGRIRHYKYRDKDEQERWMTEINAERVHFVGNRASLDGGAPRAFASDAPAQARFDAAGPPPSADAVDDIPF
ncbi:MAG: single-stranded DNA-binding protein [Myxococcales bacterium]|nr:single-stranded DNA-binding protein [Myxococcales bacterium]